MGIKDIINKLPGFSTIFLVFKVVSFILLLIVGIPILYGLADIFIIEPTKLPPFVPQDLLTKSGYGTVYGLYCGYGVYQQISGSANKAQIARDKILANNIIDVSTNRSGYPQYENLSLTLDNMFGNVSADIMDEYYQMYCYSAGIDNTTIWSLNLFIVSFDTNYIISDFYIEYTPTEHFNASLNNNFQTTKPKYGIVITEDVFNAMSSTLTTMDLNSIDWKKLAFVAIASARNGNIALFTY